MKHLSTYFYCSGTTGIEVTLFLISLLFFYGWLAVRVSHKALLKTGAFTLWDALVASLLTVWFLSLIITSLGKDQNITLSVIILNGALYFLMVGGICSFLSLRHLSPIKLFGLVPAYPLKMVKKSLLWLLVTYPLIMASQGTIELLFGSSDDTQAVVTYFLNHPGIKERLAIIVMAVIVA
ncbi:MAG: hypothetical protein K9M81_06400, partial [Chthoniobacterales bacterium]|nr:hypothetical protein [Chthoniobacterales bacterium]